MAFLSSMIKRFLTALALISVPVSLSANRSCFLGVQLALPHYESIISRGCFVLPSHFPFLCGVADSVLVTCFLVLSAKRQRQWIGLAISFHENSACFHKLRIDARFLGVVFGIVKDKDTKLPHVDTNLLQCQKTL